MKTGDIVKCPARYLPVRVRDTQDKFGVVIDVAGTSVGVEFHDLGRGHNCKGKCINGEGWYLECAELEIIEEYPHALKRRPPVDDVGFQPALGA